MMRNAYAATTLLLAIGTGTAQAQSNDAPPSTPGNPQARAYGGTSGGVAWQRSTDDRGVRGYEISRDGTVLGVRDTLSYIADDLLPGSRYEIGIVAIDTAGQRSGRAVAVLQTPGTSPTGPAGPAAPGGLVADVYSTTAGEIRWDRPSTFGLRYEVRRDGTVVAASTDATSYFDPSLQPGQSYRFVVTAIDRQGARSNPSATIVRTPGGSSGPPAPEPRPASPAGLRSVAYSSSAGAIDWRRPDTPGFRYEVSRDGTVVRNTDGISYVDQDLGPGRSYDYSVVAIDPAGRRSAPSRVTLATPGTATSPPPADNPFASPDPAGTTTVARLGYPAARDLARELVTGDYLDLYLDVDAAVVGLITEFSDDVATVSCPGGGTATGQGNGFSFTVLELDGCTLGGRSLTGDIDRRARTQPNAGGGNASVTIELDDLRIDAGDAGTLAFTGTYASNEGGGQNARCDLSRGMGYSIDTDAATLERDGETTTISGASYSRGTSRQDSGDPNQESTTIPCFSIRGFSTEGTATVVSTRFGAEPATITLRGQIKRTIFGDEERAVEVPVTPALEADFGDGSTLSLTATSVPEREVQVDILGDGAAVSFTDEYDFEGEADEE